MSAPAPDPAPTAARGPGRFRRVLATAAASLGLTLVFTLSLVGAVLVHLDLGPTRRVGRLVVNQIFQGPGRPFQGSLQVGEIDRLTLHGVSIRSVKAFDPRGVQVIDARGLRADANVTAIVTSVLAGTGDIRVLLELVHLDHADVALERGEGGVPTVAEIFLPRGPRTPPGPRQARVALERIEIDHIWAHGGLVAPTLLDAELFRSVGHFAVSPEGLDVSVEPSLIQVRAPLRVPASGNTTFALRGAPGGEGGIRMDASFTGKVGDLDVHTTAQLAGAHVEARVEIPHATAGAVAALVPGPPLTIPLRVPVSAVITAKGDLPDLDFTTRFDFDDGGWASADGKLALRSPLTVDVGVTVHQVDPRAILDVPSATPVNAKAHVSLEAGGTVKIDADATTEPFTLAGNPIPAVVAKASLADGKWKGEAKVDELGAPVHGTFSFDPRDRRLGFEVEARVPSLRGIRRVTLPLDGSASVKVDGSLRDGVVDARVHGRVDGFRVPDAVTLESGVIDGRVDGPLTALRVDASVLGQSLQAGFYAWQSVNVHASGPLLAPRVEATLTNADGESVHASAAIDARTKAATGIQVRLKRKQGEVEAKVARVAATARGLQIEGLVVQGEGVGQIQGGLVIAGKEIIGKLRGTNVDLAKVAELANYPVHVAGLANIDVDLASSGPGRRTGHVAVELVDGEAAVVKGISGVFTATFDGDRLRTDGLLRVVARADESERADERCDGAIAQLRVTGGDGRLSGPLLDPASWRAVSGRIDVAAEEWNLRCVRRLVPPFIPLPEVRGKLTTRVTVERPPGARLPTVRSFFVRTLGLEVVESTWESHHTDVEVTAAVDGTTGVTDAKVSILDGEPLAVVAMHTTLDLPTLLDHPDQRWASLRRAPLHGSVTLPRHPVTALAGLPTFVTDRVPLLTGQGGQALAGEIQVDGTIEGTIDAPAIDEHFQAFGLAQVLIAPAPSPGAAPPEPVLGPLGLPVDIDLVAGYDGHRAKVAAHIDHNHRPVTTANGEVTLPIADILAGHVHPAGSVHVAFDHLPLKEIPFLGDRDVDGQLTGRVDLDGIGDRPRLNVKLGLPGLKVGRASFPEAEVALDMDAPRHTPAGDRSAAKLQLALKGGSGGKLTTSISQDVGWADGQIPALDERSAAKLELVAERFSLAVAEPFLRGVASKVDGLLDGAAHISFLPDTGGRDGTRLGDVQLKLTSGVLHLPQLGQELHGIALDITRDKTGKVLFQGIRAEASRGIITGSGGAEFRGLLPSRADIGLSIKKGEELAISYQGAPVGNASADIKVHAVARTPSDWNVTVEVDPLDLELSPGVTRSLSVAEESDNPDIILRQAPPKPPGDSTLAPVGSGPAIAITFNPVRINVKGKLLGKVPIDGIIKVDPKKPLRVVLGGRKPQVSGVIDLPRVSVNVLHKQFVIEQGTVTLNPVDVERSFINISARWDAPEGAVYVDYAGDLSGLAPDKLKDKLNCRSADLPKDRCFASLLLGADQGSSAGGGQATQGQALAAQLIASEFSTDIAGGLSTSIGTGDDGSFRPGIQYHLGSALIELSTYGAGSSSSTITPAGEAAPKGQHSLLTIDWRFWRNWSMRGKVDVGSDQQTYGADVLWQYRY